MHFKVGATPFINGCSIFQLKVGAASFINGATLKLEPNKYTEWTHLIVAHASVCNNRYSRHFYVISRCYTNFDKKRLLNQQWSMMKKSITPWIHEIHTYKLHKRKVKITLHKHAGYTKRNRSNYFFDKNYIPTVNK